MGELDAFLSGLRNISEHQKQIVREYDAEIDNFESMLMSVRYDMNKVRTMTFKKIYDLHRQVQIAEALELGINRRLSVASATELERERRHHSVKIQRQLATLTSFMDKKSKNIIANANFAQVHELQRIMAHSHLKCFFCVYTQTMAQTVIDIELTFNNLNSEMPPIDNKVNALCNTLYGIETILMPIESERYHGLNEKLTKCVQFLNKIKNAIACEQDAKEKEKEKEKGTKLIKTFAINEVLLIVVRKICMHWREQISEIETSRLPQFAQSQTIQMFQSVLQTEQKIFERAPKSKFDAAKQILKTVYDINAKQLAL